MRHRENHELSEQSASTDENHKDAPKRTIADRRKSVRVTPEADLGRLNAAVYLGRRWLSHR